MTPKILYIANQGLPAFEAARAAVDIVCAGDSLTGRNDFGPVRYWPCRTYPDFLQILCKPFRLRIANGGITRAISDNGQQMVQDYLALFPNARCFVIGMGLSDNGTWPDMEATSKRNIGNLVQWPRPFTIRAKRPSYSMCLISMRIRGRPLLLPSLGDLMPSEITTTHG